MITYNLIKEKVEVRNSGFILLMAVITKGILVWIAAGLPVNLLSSIGILSTDLINLIDYAPEAWLSLLALVFGTLIIVVSIASENTPKLIDMFVADPLARLYIWLILLSTLENVFLQLVSSESSFFIANLIVINCYMLLPFFIFLAIPYTFYILKSTKNETVIERIFNENIKALLSSKRLRQTQILKNHIILFETTNQLHDLLQYIQFKEPKGYIIQRLGASVRLHLSIKKSLPGSYFKLTDFHKKDISFITLSEKYEQIEREQTFYEHKVLRVLDTTYLLLIKDSHYELASLCGSELFEIGKVACKLNDQPVLTSTIFHFNTMIRYGINDGLKTKEVRNVYNSLYHYSMLVHLFIDKREEQRVLQCCQYFYFYAKELIKLRHSSPLFVFLIEIISWQLKKFLIALYEQQSSQALQESILKMFTGLYIGYQQVAARGIEHHGMRSIQMGLCLFYLDKSEDEYSDHLIESILLELSTLHVPDIRGLIDLECNFIMEHTEEFWEETDQGTRNIYYSSNKDQIELFKSLLKEKLEKQLDRGMIIRNL